MKRYLLFVIILAIGAAIGVVGGRLLGAQEALKEGTILQRADVAGANGMEAILVERDLPAGKESGKHTQSGTEIVYIENGSVTFEAAGQPPKTLTAGQAFKTEAGEVHDVKNASSTAPAKALAFYIAKKGAKVEDLSKPAK